MLTLQILELDDILVFALRLLLAHNHLSRFDRGESDRMPLLIGRVTRRS
jgi:hypothetical protein